MNPQPGKAPAAPTSRPDTLADVHAAAPGTATRRYLRAIDERVARPIDWRAAPARFKHYPHAPRIVLDDGRWPGELLRGLLGLTRIIWNHSHDEIGEPVPGRRHVTIGRPAPSGGDLYPIEAYPATARGLCHYDVAHHGLESIGEGDHRPAFTRLLARSPAATPGMVLALTAVFWRNGFKYDDFAYRLACQEVGILAAQALALADPLGLDVTIHIDFDGQAADRLLGLDTAAESTLAILTISERHASGHPAVLARDGRTAEPAAFTGTGTATVAQITEAADGRGEKRGRAGTQAVRPADPPPSVSERLPYLAALHAATLRPRPIPGGPSGDPAPPPPQGPVVELPPAEPVRAADGIAHRASALNGFQPRPLALRELARILAATAAGYPGDLPATPHGPQATALYVLARRVTGLAPGLYRYRADGHALLKAAGPQALTDIAGGPLRANTRAALRTAAAVLIPAGDPLAGAARFGDLWYRLQQAEAGLVIHRATLTAAALGLTARIHSDGTNPATDTALGLTMTPWRSLSFILIGFPRTSRPTLTTPARRLAGQRKG
ncbi:SagB family peptide dehydrogenase [Actinoallomurus purpureus]|uniref:SagB family peptide dehydrogenase n=1 Tax=Actinoallomurus purpureus TaxID=478114 RepID=UPI00209326AF|nr:SagB family peptide dehydrogenase [Actinoallomurus purpureus]MCO6006962.1 SagB family peptide dehydrogenase [Actinoallomurus purpureus]